MGKVLSGDDIKRIVEAAFEILERVGFLVESDGIRSLLIEAGCQYNPSDGRVRMPRELADKLLSTCPSHIRLADQRGNVVEVGEGRPSVFFSGNALNLAEDGQLKPIDRKGLARMARILDAPPGDRHSGYQFGRRPTSGDGSGSHAHHRRELR